MTTTLILEEEKTQQMRMRDFLEAIGMNYIAESEDSQRPTTRRFAG